VSLIHATTLSEKASRLLHDTVTRASKKFRLGSGWLAAPSASAALPDDLIRYSLQQNNIVFSNEGLTLLGLDRIYTFKLAVAAYMTAEGQEERSAALAAAVNELRLLVLSYKGRRISVDYLQRSYMNIGLSEARLRMINNAYKSEYKADGIAMNSEPGTAAAAAAATTTTTTTTTMNNIREIAAIAPILGNRDTTTNMEPVPQESEIKKRRQAVLPPPHIVAATVIQAASPPPPPSAAAQNNVVVVAAASAAASAVAKPRTIEARPLTVQEVEILRLSQWLPKGAGPVTPNHFEDVTPITRGEWGMLMGGRATGNLAAVQSLQTC